MGADMGKQRGSRYTKGIHQAMGVVRGTIRGSETGTPPRPHVGGDKKDTTWGKHSGPCWRTARGQSHAGRRGGLTRSVNWLVSTARLSTARSGYMSSRTHLSCYK